MVFESDCRESMKDFISSYESFSPVHSLKWDIGGTTERRYYIYLWYVKLVDLVCRVTENAPIKPNADRYDYRYRAVLRIVCLPFFFSSFILDFFIQGGCVVETEVIGAV